MKNLTLILSIIALSISNVISFAGGKHAHSHDKQKKTNCTTEHAAMGHCSMEEDPTHKKANKHEHSNHHSGAHGHDSTVGKRVSIEQAEQTVRVDMLDSMRFVFNDTFEIKAGKTIRFDVSNKGQIRHEFSIGNVVDQESHAKIMMENPTMIHGDGEAAITVEAGETKTLTWRFEGNEEIVFACTLPGHYQAGMIHKQNIIQ